MSGKGDGSAGDRTRDCKMVKVSGKVAREIKVDETISGFKRTAKIHIMRLTEEALLEAPAVSIAPATDAAAVVAGTMLEVVAPGVGMFSETPTAPQT